MQVTQEQLPVHVGNPLPAKLRARTHAGKGLPAYAVDLPSGRNDDQRRKSHTNCPAAFDNDFSPQTSADDHQLGARLAIRVRILFAEDHNALSFPGPIFASCYVVSNMWRLCWSAPRDR